ncbi:MAG: hypothetical protein QM758_08165 [Armatimonas sp.]
MKFNIISYGEFFDIPRMINCHSEDKVYYFHCEMNPIIGNYSEKFKIFLFSMPLDDFIDRKYRIEIKEFVGEVFVSEMQFDATKRKSFEVSDKNEIFLTT